MVTDPSVDAGAASFRVDFAGSWCFPRVTLTLWSVPGFRSFSYNFGFVVVDTLFLTELALGGHKSLALIHSLNSFEVKASSASDHLPHAISDL